MTMVAKHDPARFGDLIAGVVTLATAPYTNDEEASGIIDAKNLLGDGWFLMVDQAHYALDTELVQGGQILALYVAPPAPPGGGGGSTGDLFASGAQGNDGCGNFGLNGIGFVALLTMIFGLRRRR